MSFNFSINTNLGALQAYQALQNINTQTQKAQLQLATGLRINSVADDTSGYRVGKELQGQVAVMTSAQGNVGAAQDLLNTAESALSNINDLLNQIKGKATDANDPTKNLTSLANDVVALGTEISSIFSNTNFNGTSLLSGTSLPTGSNFAFQTGVGETTTINFGTMSTIDLSSLISATSATVATLGSTVDSIQTAVQNALGSIGNYDQRLSVKSNYLASAIQNANSSISRLFDANVAQEQLASTKGQIQQQVATSMLAQLNSAPQNLLKLFQ